jgi:glycosyltransferase involved in cell wall biosynthesis
VVPPRARAQPARRRAAGARELRIVFLTHYFPPEVGAPQTRIAELAAGLRARGADITVHTGFPHYPDGRIAAPYRNRPLRRERGPDGVRIVRSAVVPAPNRGLIPRLADHLAFAGSALATSPASGRADVVVAETPPLFLAAAAPAYKRAPLVLHVADLWPESAVALGALRSRSAIALARRLEHRAYRRATAIAVPTRGIADALEREPETAGKVVHLPPAVDVRRFAGLPEPPAGGQFHVLYAGTLGLAQGLDTLVQAARLAPEVRITVAGDGARADAIARAAPPNVRLLGAVPADRVPALYGAADAGAVLLRGLPLFEGALPTKLLECMAAGRPVVLAARGEAAELVRTAGAGIVAAPDRADELARAFRALAADRERARALGARGRAAARDFDRAASVERWAALLEDVVTRGRRRAPQRRPRRRARSSPDAAGG